MGSTLMGGGTTKTESKDTPWGPQGAALENAFTSATSIFKEKQGTPWYTGDLHAGLNPLTQQGLEGVGTYAGGAGASAAGAVAGSANPMMGGGALAMDAYGNLINQANTDPTAGNIANAGKYADNPYMDQMIAGASRDINRNLTENVLPSIDRDATATGNINSTRSGVAEGIATRGANDAIGDISAAMRGGAYKDGLGLAESARTANMGAGATAASGFGNLYGQGLQGSAQGMDMTYRNLDAMVKSGQISQADAQSQLDAELMRWTQGDSRDMDLLSKYYGVIGSSDWGGTTNTKTKTPGPGLLQIAAGGLATYAGAGGKFSDRRLKRNIEPVGTHGKLTLYEYNYLWDAPEAPARTGVMADEVAIHAPHALGPTVQGYATVNYEALGLSTPQVQ